MSYIGNTSDVEQEKNEFHHNRSTSNLVTKKMGSQKASEGMWNDKRDIDSDSEISDSEHFLAKGIN